MESTGTFSLRGKWRDRGIRVMGIWTDSHNWIISEDQNVHEDSEHIDESGLFLKIIQKVTQSGK